MNYPLISEYINAVKAAEENFDQLRSLRPVLDDLGEPVMSSGNFAVVFKMKDVQTGKTHAVKCFLKEQEGRAEAYRKIAEELGHIKSQHLTPVRFLESELFVDTQNSEETEFPVLLMDWVEGKTLDMYVYSNKFDGSCLSSITHNFYVFSKWLLLQPFAHGDLKPDNIIVNDEGNLVVIDYDGMFVPKMDGQVARETGTPNYRNPFFENNCIESQFSKRIDDFAIVHLLLTLRVYSIYPQIIDDQKDFALFDSNDFSRITKTPIFQQLISCELDPLTCYLFSLFQKIIYTGRISKEEWDALSFEGSIRNFIDMEKSMCDLDNIVMAVELAYSSMLYKDPARNEYYIDEYKERGKRLCLALDIQNSLKMHEWPFDTDGIKYSRLKPNGKEKREGIIFNLEEYSIRYLFGVVKFLAINNEFPHNIYGGGTDVFTLNYDESKYESYLDEFVRTQEENAEHYKYLYVFDIRKFFPSVNMSKLKSYYFNTDFMNVEWYAHLFDKTIIKNSIQGLNPCSEVDFFFANLYLRVLDSKLMQYRGIKYYRYGDDIRIFTNDKFLLEPLKKVIESVLLSLQLELNRDKTKLIDVRTDKIELAKACFVLSSRIYYGANQATSLLDNQKLKDIIDNDLTTTYLFELLNKRSIDESHLGDMFYILTNVHKNAAFYKKTIEHILDAGIDYDRCVIELTLYGSPTTFLFVLRNIIEILEEKNVESFIKYWILRSLFCSNKQYYKEILTFEEQWKDLPWYLKPCFMIQLEKIIDSFRTNKADNLLTHISEYIMNIISPFTRNTISN